MYCLTSFYRQNKAAKLIGDASSLLKNDAKDKNFGPVKVEEDSRGIYTAASNVLEASKETSLPFVLEGNCGLLAVRQQNFPLIFVEESASHLK